MTPAKHPNSEIKYFMCVPIYRRCAGVPSIKGRNFHALVRGQCRTRLALLVLPRWRTNKRFGGYFGAILAPSGGELAAIVGSSWAILVPSTGVNFMYWSAVTAGPDLLVWSCCASGPTQGFGFSWNALGAIVKA